MQAQTNNAEYRASITPTFAADFPTLTVSGPETDAVVENSNATSSARAKQLALNAKSASTSAVLGASTIATQSAYSAATGTPVASINAKKITVALLGDSMIDTLEPDFPQLTSALMLFYPNTEFTMLNYGVGSSNIEYGLHRLKNEYDYLDKHHSSLISQKPDIVVIESFGYNNFGNTPAGLDQQWLAIGQIVSTLQKELPESKIVLAATVAPNSSFFAKGAAGIELSSQERVEKTQTINKYLENIVNFATSQQLPLADAYHPSLDGTEGKREFINASDNIHPSKTGAQLFADVIAQAIVKNSLIE